MGDSSEFLEFYVSKYQLLLPEITKFKQKYYFGDKTLKRCKFCKKSAPDVKFNYSSHAFSQALGNNIYFSFNECIECNRYFSSLENHISNYLGLIRIILPIKTKNSSITLKTKKNKSHLSKRFESKTINIRDAFDDKIADINTDDQEVRLKYITNPFIPVLVYKMFLKYAFSFMPESELNKCNKLVLWLMNKSDKGLRPIIKPLYLYFVESFDNYDLLEIDPVLLVKNPDIHENYPQYSFILRVYNIQFQIFIPSDDQSNSNIIIPCPFVHYGYIRNKDLKIRYLYHDLSHEDKIILEQGITINFKEYKTFEVAP
jgi:hypothetical protein